MENINDFNLGVSLILGRLYQTFPVPSILDVASLMEDGSEDSNDKDRQRVRLHIFTASVHFLKEENFIRFISHVGPRECQSFSGVVLTSKGLAALSKTPEAIEKYQSTIGDKLVDYCDNIVKAGTQEGMFSLIKFIMG